MNKLQYILTKLSEECAELSKEASKASIFGMDSYHPQDINKSTQARKLLIEYIDVTALFHMLIEHLQESDLSSFEIMESTGDMDEMLEAKVEKVNQWLEHSRSLGFVDGE